MGTLGLLARDHKSLLEGRQPRLQGLPWVIDGQQQHPVAEMLHHHLLPLKRYSFGSRTAWLWPD
jgi:hypothetical protein